MKSLILLAVLSSVTFAQAPAAKTGTAAPKPAASKPAAAKTTAPAPPSSGRLLNPAAWTKQAPAEYKAKFTTAKGDFIITVHREWAPLGADRFYNLVRSGFFTNVSFYRVVPNFVVQFGAAPDPKVEAAWSSAKIKDDAVKQSNTKGRVTFAMGGPGTRTTQVFINLKDNSTLDKYPGAAFAPVGEVTEGMDVVSSLYSGYGDMAEQGGNGPSQAMVTKQGKPYLDKSFPNLDSIKSATVEGEAAAAPAAAKPKPAPGAAKPKPAAPKPAPAK
jgi:peptidyl-prolyl cis-trans isomerase A (cyclophilin A)